MNNSIVDYLNTSGQKSDFASRQSLATANGISNYSGTADQNIALLNNLKAKAPTDATVSPIPKTTGAISVDQLKKENPIIIPKVNPDTTNYGGLGTSIADSIASTYNTVKSQYDTMAAKQNTDANSINASLEKLLGKSADTISANETAGVNAETEKFNKYINDLTNINAESSALQRESQAIPLKLQEQVAGQGVTDAGLAPTQAGELRKNAIQQLTLAQRADIAGAVATGSLNSLNLAKEKAQRIIDLKYKPIEEELDIRMKQFNLNKDLLASVDKKRTEALSAALEVEKNMLDYKKSTSKEKSDLIIKASPYAPKELLDLANNAPDASSAAIILGSYAQDYLATQKTKQEIIKLQIENGTYDPNNTSSVGIISKDSGFGLADYKKGIAGVESAGSGGYSAIGVETKGGDRAYGKYQVMGANIPSWTKEALGYSLTPQQFLNNPDAQEKVLETQAEKNYAKYGNWDDVASVWFSGKPLSGNNASDGFNSVPEYVKKVRKNMGVGEVTPVQIAGVPDRVITAVSNGQIQGGQLVSATTGQVPKNVTSDKQDGLLALKDLVNKMDEYKKLYKEVQSDGVFGTGIVTGIKNSIIPTTNVTALNMLRSEITDLLSRARSGAALTVVEEARYAAKLPTSYSADNLFGNPDVEIDGLKSSLQGTLNSKMSGYGVIFAPSQEDIYYARMKGATTSVANPNNQSYGYNY